VRDARGGWLLASLASEVSGGDAAAIEDCSVIIVFAARRPVAEATVGKAA
jgi:hypothetical protein